ncbi:hypothetical protein J2Z62_000801 [Mycoplasmoides fastidiosum]|uniref:Uncharacterized protein n=1 Tax=Mycoplasmoides fastidiosum TaxID=92758 RepID=A0ABU0M0I5_9BACT|nr:hypothetical protein [Mycoplasmoides fastidiosum]MDQ0514363.1 hypothetical protein [Mycoplasmoides fastidiosum]UUD38037.1 hypothetical protein NPA10_01420 [Mycoplasmoides fastidiosum]
MTSKFKKNRSSKTHNSKRYFPTKWLISCAILVSTSLGLGTAIYLIQQAHQQHLTDSKFDPVQARVARFTQSGQATPPGGGYNFY